jgi:DNA-binding transcriptional ArsR family regulator
MTRKQNQQSAKVVPIRPEEDKRKSEKKWGRKVMQLGFSMIPSLLFRAQQRLGLNPTQLAIIVQLADYWWDPDRKPFPSKKKLSERLGLSPRQIQRQIAELEMAGLVERVQRYAPHKGKISNEYDLTGLVKRLKKLEPEFRKAKEEVEDIRRQVKRRGGLRQRRNKK